MSAGSATFGSGQQANVAAALPVAGEYSGAAFIVVCPLEAVMLGSGQQETLAAALPVARVYTGASAVAARPPEVTILGSGQQSASTILAHRAADFLSSDAPELPRIQFSERKVCPRPFVRRLRYHMDSCAGTRKSQNCFGGLGRLCASGALDAVFV